MTRRPTVLDAFCGGGGTGEGLYRAGFDVYGIDNNPDRLEKYPHPCEHVEDAVPWILRHGHKFDAIFTGPTCTGYSQGTSALPDRLTRYDRLIGATRAALQTTGRPYVIENVVSKDTRAELIDPMMLCWTEFHTPGSVTDTDGTKLWMRRHRLFESNVGLMGAGGCQHPKDMQCAGAYGAARRDAWEAKHIRRGGYVPKSTTVLQQLLGIDWLHDETDLFLAIPPAYTEHIGDQLLAHHRVMC